MTSKWQVIGTASAFCLNVLSQVIKRAGIEPEASASPGHHEPLLLPQNIIGPLCKKICQHHSSGIV